MLYLFLFHIDYTIHANHVFIKKIIKKIARYIKLNIKYRVIVDTLGSDSVFPYLKLTRQVKVVQSYVNE